MTPRELLELAAKAYGIKLEWNNKGQPGYWDEWRGLPQWIEWNPLTDDGDALRLAVKLNLKTVFHPVLRQALVRRYFASGDEWTENAEDHADNYAATRRAIVRAAAEIGRQMP